MRNRRLVGAALALGLVLGTFSPSQAHDLMQRERLWKSGDKCLFVEPVIGHRNDGADYDMWFEAWVFTLRDYTIAGVTLNCKVKWFRPIEKVRLTWWLQKRRLDGSIKICRKRNAWVYNNKKVYIHYRWYNIEDITPCGKGNYRLRMRSQTWYNGAWRPAKGAQVSPWHWFQGNG